MDIALLPAESRDSLIATLRENSRHLVRELGFMRPTLAGSALSPSAVHAIIEIGLTGGLLASELAKRLRLDKSNTSRQLAKLEDQGLIVRDAAPGDGRASTLHLTTQGRALLTEIDGFATSQILKAMRRMTPDEQSALVRSLHVYANALGADNDVSPPELAPRQHAGSIVTGYVPGAIGDIASLHARYYAQRVGFGVFFERRVATELADFAQSLPDANRQLWTYGEGGRTLASIAMDGDAAGNHAHLRWFIVDDSLRGSGIGRRLLAEAMAWADARYDRTWLWTFRGLDAARHLYESMGFELVEQAEGEQWGSVVTEQRFERVRPANGSTQ